MRTSPLGVKFFAAFYLIKGALLIYLGIKLGGVFGLAHVFSSANALTYVGVPLFGGLLLLILGTGLIRLKEWARWLVLIVTGISVLAARLLGAWGGEGARLAGVIGATSRRRTYLLVLPAAGGEGAVCEASSGWAMNRTAWLEENGTCYIASNMLRRPNGISDY